MSEPVPTTNFVTPTKAGTLSKRSVGKSFFSMKNWKERHFVSSPEGIFYFASPTDKAPQGVVLWKDVLEVRPSISKDEDKDASDASKFYFGIRFVVPPRAEKLLLLRCNSAAELQAWYEQMNAMHDEYDRIDGMGETDEEEEGVPSSRTARRTAPQQGTILGGLSSRLRGMVSLKKERYQQDGFDLDLAYITPNLVAMGFPSEGSESIFRNPYNQVLDFFEKYHKDKYLIINLCSERSYPADHFGGKFARFPFDDHNACPLELITSCCQYMHEFISADPTRVVGVHCKAGKGRTGLIAAAYLLYANICPTAVEALKLFAEKRTKDGKGVQIPSQVRYLEYYETMLKSFGGQVPKTPVVTVGQIILHGNPHFDLDGGCDPYVIVETRKANHGHVAMGTAEGSVRNPMEVVWDTREVKGPAHFIGAQEIDVAVNVTLTPGDYRFTVFDADSLSKDDKMFSFWFNTAFLPPEEALHIGKLMLDDAVKDKKNELFDADFAITMKYKIRS